MNTAILQPEVQKFIQNYEGDLSKLAFSGSPFAGVTIQELLEQIGSRRKIRYKLPTWYSTSNIYYPPKLNLEQTSSEVTSKYKSGLVSGSTMADITGGFGVDSYFFSKEFDRVDHCELSEELSKIAEHNFKTFGVENVHCFNSDGLGTIKNRNYDLIYADPSRRTNDKQKVFLLEDCTPDIISNIDHLFTSTRALMIKTSPMLDITIGINSLKKVNEVHVVAVNNEVKELLWLLGSEDNQSPKVVTVNFTKEMVETYEFQYGVESNNMFGDPGQYLYEPNSAIMKSGGFSTISGRFNLLKLHRHSHLFTSEELVDFPGRRFSIKKVVPYSRKEMKSGIDFAKANVAVRNFPEPVDTLRKKWKINDGGDIYVFFTTLTGERKVMLICEKI